MAVCDVCDKRYFLRPLNRRLDVPEYRSMIGYWPWVEVRVCDGCLEEYDRTFIERLRLLALEVMENDEPIAEKVCLACGTLESPKAFFEASRWVDSRGLPTRRARFYLCSRHVGLPYIEGVVVSTSIKDAESIKALLEELPLAGSDLLARVEGWRPEEGKGPAGALDFVPARREDDLAPMALEFWNGAPEGLDAKAAWLGPIRKDYRLRYRLDMVRDFRRGQRETYTIVRIGRDRFATYRTLAKPPAK